MIEFNLLPDVKLEYIKAERSRRLVLTISVLVSIVAVALLVLMLVINGLQKKHLNDLTRDINSESSKLQSAPQISKILTVQNQLGSLTDLHASKPAVSRLFDYLNQLTPSTVSISNLTIDMNQQTATITGSADAISSVNKLVDTLKFTTYKSDGDSQSTKAFSNVVLGSFGLNSAEGSTKQATYTITFGYDKPIFDITKDVKLTVPNLTTTRVDQGTSTDLFQASPTPPKSTTSKGNQ